MALNLGELVATISADDSRFRRTISGVHSSLQAVGKVGSLAALAGTATHLAVALAPAAGILAVLPGAFIAVKVASAALGLALAGVSDALGSAVSGDMKKFNEQLKAMPPAARVVVRELGTAFAGLQATAQNAFFKPMTKNAKGLGKELRVPLHRGIATITASMGRFGAKILGVAREGKSLSFMKSLSLAIARGIDGAGKGIKPLIRGIRDFAGASLGSFGRAGNALGRLMARMGKWLSRMGRSGKATGWINKAVTTLKTLGRIGGNVGRTIGNIFKNAGAGQSQGLLTTIEQLTARMLEWSRSAKGQEQIATVFRLINETATSLAGILPLLAGPLGAVATIIKGMPGPAQGTVSQFLAWALVIGFLTSRLAPLFGILGKLGRVAGTVGRIVGKGFAKVGPMVGRAAATAGRAVGRLAASAARGAMIAARAAGRAALSFATAAGRMALAAGRVALSVALAAGRMALSMGLAVARVVAGWTVMAARAVISAAIMAAQWLIAFWPVALVVAAAAIAVVLIIKYWDKIVQFFTKTLPKWLKKGFDFLVKLIKNAAKFGFLGPVGLIIAHWGKISKFFTKTVPDGVRKGLDKVTGFLRGLPGRVRSAVGNMGSLLYNAGRDILIGLWNGLVSMASWLARSLGNLIKRIIPGPVQTVLGIHSPSRVFAGFGMNLAQGLAQGMDGGAGLVSKAATNLAGAAALGGGTIPRSARGAGRGGTAGRPAPAEVRITLDATGADGEMKRFLRKIVKVDGRGSVQLAFGKGTG